MLAPEAQTTLHNLLVDQAQAKPATFAEALRALSREWIDDAPSLPLRAMCLLLADLIEQGWLIKFDLGRVVVEPSGLARDNEETVEQVKLRVQRGLKVGRDRQLQETSTRQFLARMERLVGRTSTKRTSVLDIIDLGTDLARSLERTLALPEGEQLTSLEGVVDPVVEICEAGARCSDTGLKLIDVWRYFRHTWSHEYRPIPGRQMMILVRNRARPGRPIMGAAMLASPVMRLAARDSWIGWLRHDARSRVEDRSRCTAAFANALVDRLDRSIAEVRWDDLASAAEIAEPTEAAAFRLAQRAAGYAYQRELELKAFYEAQDLDGASSRPHRGEVKSAHADVDWNKASEDVLFMRKRCESLSQLLYAKHVFLSAGLTQDPERVLGPLFDDRRGQKAIDVALSELRKAGLSSRVADLSLCGAVDPYGPLLGGKLVALILASEEVRAAYASRYGGQTSLITSQMAGRPVSKPADLQVLTTTSLYGLGSSQYNRLFLSAAQHKDLPFDMSWEAIGRSLTGGYGTSHLGDATTEALRCLSEARHDSRRVNNRFGEGTSPRLRQVREGLDTLGIESDQVLHHATPRIFYGFQLAPGAKDALLNLGETTPSAPSASTIAAAWRARWLLGRVRREETLPSIASLGPTSIRANLHADPQGQFPLPFSE